ncbi:hypothetical protein JCM16303_004573 [Sporobolomyces ruberrimus]
MRTSKPKEDPLSHTLSTLDVPEILKLLCSYEIRRQISLDKAEEVWHPIGQRWIRVKKEDSVYLGKVRESAQDGAAFFSSVDLAWRRLLFESNALAASPDYDRLSTIVDTYFKAPVEPYSQREFSLDAGLDMVVEFGKMYTILLGNWREGRRRDRWIEQNSPGLDTNVLINVTKTYERVVRQTAIRVEAIFDKYISEKFTPENVSDIGGDDADDNASRSSKRSRESSSQSSVASGGSKRGSHSHTGTRQGARGDAEQEDTEMEDDQAEAESSHRDQNGDTQNQHRSSPASSISHSRLNGTRELSSSRSPEPLSQSVEIQRNGRPSSIARPVASRSPSIVPENTQFPQPLTKPTYLSRISRSPSRPVKQERSGSPFGGTPRRGLPADIRAGAEENQSKLAKVRRSSIMDNERENERRASSEHATSSVTRRREKSSEVDGGEGSKVRPEQTEREKTEEVRDQGEDGKKQPLTSTPSGILMPPPSMTKSSQPSSSSENAPLPSSSEQEPSTLPEPSTLVSSPARPESQPPRKDDLLFFPAAPRHDLRSTQSPNPTGPLSVPEHATGAAPPQRPAPPTLDAPFVYPSSSNDEPEPSTQKSSQDYQLPAAAQTNHAPPNTTLPRAGTDPESQSQSQSDSQSRSTDSETSFQPVVAATSSSAPSPFAVAAAAFSSHPKILVPDTSDSNNASSSNSGSSSMFSAPSQTQPTLLSPVKARRKSRTPSVDPQISQAPRRSSRLSKSPAPTELAIPCPRKRTPPTKRTTSVMIALPPVFSSAEDSDSQDFLTQAPAQSFFDFSQPFATQAEPIFEEEESHGPGGVEAVSQDSSGLTYISHEELARLSLVRKEAAAANGGGKAQGRNRDEEDEALAELPDIVDADFEEFDSPRRGKSGSPAKSKISFGELERRATGGPPAEEAFILDDE